MADKLIKIEFRLDGLIGGYRCYVDGEWTDEDHSGFYYQSTDIDSAEEEATDDQS